MAIDLITLSIRKAHEAFQNKLFTVEDLARAYLEHIKDIDGDIHAYLEIYDDVLAQAKAAQERFTNGTATLLTGIPFAIKDNILITGKKASAASKILEGYVAPYDATVITRLKKEGAIFLGRTNMDEFAMGSSTEKSAFGPTKNPHDTTRIPGGSSGGSAAAVASNGALVSLGSDTGGSIRQPAALCGLVGLKPTYGAVSRSGLMAMGSSLDQIGPFAKTVDDARIVFHAIEGKDELDSTTIERKPIPQKKSLRIGVPESFVTGEGIDADVLENFRATLDALKNKGHEIVSIEVPSLPLALPAYYIVMPAEVSSNLARFDGVRYGLHVSGDTGIMDYMKSRGVGFGPEPRRRILLGTYVLSAGYYDSFYGKAQSARDTLRKDLSRVFTEVDVIATPTTPAPAWKLGEKNNDPLAMYLADIFTVSANIAGVPALSVPSGTVVREGKKLPIGFHIMGDNYSEEVLFGLGEDIEHIHQA